MPSTASVSARLLLPSLLAAALGAGCASAPPPAPPRAAAVERAGVSLRVPRVEVSTRPGAPVKDAVAVYVVIENQGSQEIVVAKEDFALGPKGGARLAAISPAYLSSAVAWTGGPGRGRVVRAGGFGDTLYLPPMQQGAAPGRVSIDSLPDGTLGPGGRAEGYLYFPRAAAPGAPLVLDWRVRDEASQRPLTELRLALVNAPR